MGLLDGLSVGALQLWTRVQQIFPNAIMTSGLRSASSNAGIPGASSTSQHLTGNAFDFVVPGVDPKTVQSTIATQLGLPFGQSIAEYGAGMGPRNHLSTGTKGQFLVGNNGSYSPATVSLTSGQTAGRKALEQILGPQWGGWMADDLANSGAMLASPGNAIDNAINSVSPDWNSWFQRAALGVFALIFIAAAVFTFRTSDIVTTARKALS